MRTTTLLAAIYLVALMFSLGLRLGLAKSEPRRTKWASLIRGLLFNLLVLPLLTILMIRLWHPSGTLSAALLLLALAPGGRYAPYAVDLARGDLALSIELMLFLVKLTTFTAPLATKKLLGVTHLEVSELTLVAELLAWQILPYYLGKTIRRRRPALADRLQQPLERFALAIAVVVIVDVVLSQRLRGLMFLADRGWITLLSVAFLSAAVGWLVGWPSEGRRRCFAIAANARNGGLALMIATLGFPDDLPLQWALVGCWLALLLLNYSLALVLGRRLVSVPTREPPSVSGPVAPV